MNTAILLTSRNNYVLLEKLWLKKINRKNEIIINIDEGSNDEQKLEGRRICDKNDIVFLESQPGMCKNVLSACDYLKNKMDLRYLIWFQHDCWPLQEDFFRKFDSLVSSGKLNNFGTVGFNGIARNIIPESYEKAIDNLYSGESPFAVTARSPLEKGDSWYCGIKSRRIRRPIIETFRFVKPFSVEIGAWFAMAVNVDLFRKHVDCSRPFHFFHSWDDICFQFLNKNTHNITIPGLYVDHQPELKPDFGMPKRSVRLSYKGDDTYHSSRGFGDKPWKKYWGFDYDNRKSFKKVQKEYKGTLINAFYNHDPQNGPLMSFDI